MNDSEIRHTFFYAMQEAGLYDATIEWVAPYYKQMHEMMLRLAMESAGPLGTSRQHALALDIGCGTGAEAIPLLRANPNLRLLGVDLCAPMCAEFSHNAAKAKIPADRYHLMVGDILDGAITNKLTKEAWNISHRRRFRLIISAFTIHHLTRDQKLQVFRLVHRLLDSGGVFLLGDLFNYGEESDWLSRTIFNWETRWIANNFDTAIKKAPVAGRRERAKELRRLKGEWLDHYLMENKLDSVTTQLTLLRKAGFRNVGNPFRYWQVGLVWARK